ncbi:MAG: hypothetical protein HFJ28_01655 [Clostridia bacterium]|nr:hypothetical protein [Clostridia bacterium]
MKGKKTLLIVVIIVIALIIMAGGAFAALYFATDLLKTNDQLFAKYLFEDNELSTLLVSEVIQNQEQFKKENSYSSEGILKVEMQKKEGQVQTIQMNTNSKHNKDTKRSYTEAVLKDGEENVLNFSYINDNDVYGVKFDQIYANYIGIRNKDLKQFARTIGLPEETVNQIPDTIPLEVAKNTEIITKEEAKYLEDTYYKIIIDSIAKENYSKTEKVNIKIEDKTYEASGYKLMLNQNEISTILNNVVKKAKDDTQTMNILEKIITELEIGKQTSPEDFVEALEQLAQNMQKEEFTIEIIVYQSEGKTIRTQLNMNKEIGIMFDIANNTKEKQKVIITIEDLKQDVALAQINLQKTISRAETMHEVSIVVGSKESSYQITSNTTLGNISNNTIHNTSSITIKDYQNNNIKASYDKTIKMETEAPEIQELKNSNTVIVNNYSKEQLEQFFEGIIENASRSLIKVVEQLELNIADENDIMKYMQGAESAVITVANANGLEPIGNLTANFLITAINQTIYLQMNRFNNINNNKPQTSLIPQL